MSNLFLYAATVLIWGSSWIGIQFQLGVVPPEISLVYRFAIAATILLVFCRVTGRRIAFRPREHALIALQGFLLFSTNFYVYYLASQHLPSGLVSIIFGTTVVANIGFGALFFGYAVRPRIAFGALIGICGITIVFWPQLMAFDLNEGTSLALVLGLTGTVSASLGMLLSGWNQARGLPLVQTNAVGMVYGTIAMLIYALFADASFAFDLSVRYVGSLLYLAVFSSVLAFGIYLTLLGRIGADRAGYATVLFPIVALAISTVVEDFSWDIQTAAGVLLVLSGNVLILTKNPR